MKTGPASLGQTLAMAAGVAESQVLASLQPRKCACELPGQRLARWPLRTGSPEGKGSTSAAAAAAARAPRVDGVPADDGVGHQVEAVRPGVDRRWRVCSRTRAWWSWKIRSLALDDLSSVPAADELVGLTPTLFEHVNPLGTYTFDTDRPAGQLRPLRAREAALTSTNTVRRFRPVRQSPRIRRRATV